MAPARTEQPSHAVTPMPGSHFEAQHAEKLFTFKHRVSRSRESINVKHGDGVN